MSARSFEKEMVVVTGIRIRDEEEPDYLAITETTESAFATLAISEHTEQFIIRALREAGALTISLVAEAEGRVVGHVALSPVTLSDGSPHWFGLGPISVRPELHRRGIGSLLMEHALARLRSMEAGGCILVGDPGYYRRFGFRSLPGLEIEGVPPQYVLALPFDESRPQGMVVFHDAFRATA